MGRKKTDAGKSADAAFHERRRHERVSVAPGSQVYITDAKGARLGKLRMIARGGLLMASSHKFPKGKEIALHIVDETEGIRCPVRAQVRYSGGQGVGVQFVDLDPGAAVEIGILIGKFYAADVAPA
jgi:Tfp pilus assembly protein PilZ